MKAKEVNLRFVMPVLLGVFILAVSAPARPRFIFSDVHAPGSELLVCDLDGDGLKDLVVMDDLNLSIFYQDPANGFTAQPQQTYRLEHRPCLVWTAKLGGPAESLLVMNSDGVNELDFTHRGSPPVVRQIIRQHTLIPEAAAGANAMFMALSAETGGPWPLLLLPAVDGIHVWQHGNTWSQIQLIGNSTESSVRPLAGQPGYARSLDFFLSLADINRDGRDDLMISHATPGGSNAYALYLQQTNGQFGPDPALTYNSGATPHSWLYWADLNRDGKVDLIKNVWLQEPSFLPGIASGKVLVNTYMTDTRGRIPDRPQTVLRKNDYAVSMPLIDLDGDGYPDLALGSGLLETRDTATRAVTTKSVDYSLRLYFFRPGAGFPAEPDCQANMTVHFEPRNADDIFERYVTLGGDFTGDGKIDMLVRDSDDTISVYPFVSREKGFSARPDFRFNVPEEVDSWEIKDLNHDGISDLIVAFAGENRYRVFISRK